jgi:hypothetical protein
VVSGARRLTAVTTPLPGVQRALGDAVKELDREKSSTFLRNHHRFLAREFGSELKRYKQRLIDPITTQAEGVDTSLGESVGVRAIGRSIELGAPDYVQPSDVPASSECMRDVFYRPSFDMASPLSVTQSAGQLSTMSRGSLEGTLETASVVGPFPPLAPSKTFGGTASGTGATYNIALATIGKRLTLPGDPRFWLVQATVVTQLEQSQGRQPVNWGNFIALLPGSAALPLTGLAVVWCDIIVSLHTTSGSAYSPGSIVSGDVSGTREISIHGDNFYIINNISAVMQPGTASYLLVIDARAFAWAEGRPDGGEGFSEIAIHEQFPGDALGSFGFATALGVLRVVEMTVSACPIPVLSRFGDLRFKHV